MYPERAERRDGEGSSFTAGGEAREGYAAAPSSRRNIHVPLLKTHRSFISSAQLLLSSRTSWQ